jgi:hypothetical protein
VSEGVVIIFRMASNRAMNELIRQRARRGVGVIDRLGDLGSQERRAAFHEAHSAFERAVRNGDTIARDMASATIDRLFDEARAARQATPEPLSGFDGGPRGVRRTGKGPPGHLQETAGELFLRAMTASRIEREERAADF